MHGPQDIDVASMEPKQSIWCIYIDEKECQRRKWVEKIMMRLQALFVAHTGVQIS